MVSSEEEEILGILDLVGQQQTNGFHALFASVHIVPQEEIIGVGREATVLKQSQQISELTMDVSWRGGGVKRKCCLYHF